MGVWTVCATGCKGRAYGDMVIDVVFAGRHLVLISRAFAVYVRARRCFGKVSVRTVEVHDLATAIGRLYGSIETVSLFLVASFGTSFGGGERRMAVGQMGWYRRLRLRWRGVHCARCWRVECEKFSELVLFGAYYESTSGTHGLGSGQAEGMVERSRELKMTEN